MPTVVNKDNPDHKKLWLLPAFADLRIGIIKNLEITLQPGYNFFRDSYSTDIPYRVTSKTKGTFYGGAGLTGYVPFKGESPVFVQLKYNHFIYNGKVNTYENPVNVRTSNYSYTEKGVSFGAGFSF